MRKIIYAEEAMRNIAEALPGHEAIMGKIEEAISKAEAVDVVEETGNAIIVYLVRAGVAPINWEISKDDIKSAFSLFTKSIFWDFESIDATLRILNDLKSLRRPSNDTTRDM